MEIEMKTKSAEKSPHGRIAFCLPHKFFHSCLTCLINPFALENFPDCHEDNFYVQPQGPIVHIPDIQVELFFPGNGVAAVDRAQLMPGRTRAAALCSGVYRSRYCISNGRGRPDSCRFQHY